MRFMILFSGCLCFTFLGCEDGKSGSENRDPADSQISVDAATVDGQTITEDAVVTAADAGMARIDTGSDPVDMGRIERDQSVLPDACVPSPETCNGVDEDCDGNIDESPSGQPADCGVGACVASPRCGDGAWVCEAGMPSPERCLGDGVDEDCDGMADEACACIVGEERPCEALGACASPGNSVQRCEETCQQGECNAAFGVCAGPIEPVDEICDGLDNDCDGIADEDLQEACGPDAGACQPGIRRCVGGEWSECEGGQGPGYEVCGGGDEDCDGRVDEVSVEVSIPIPLADGEYWRQPTLRVLDGGLAVILEQDAPNHAINRDLWIGVWELDGTPRSPFRRVLPQSNGYFSVVHEHDRPGLIIANSRPAGFLPDLPDVCESGKEVFALDRTATVTDIIGCVVSYTGLTMYGTPNWVRKLLLSGNWFVDVIHQDTRGPYASFPMGDLTFHVMAKNIITPASEQINKHDPQVPIHEPSCSGQFMYCAFFDAVMRPGGLLIAASDGESPLIQLTDGSGRPTGGRMTLEGGPGWPRLTRVGDTVYAVWGAEPMRLLAYEPDGPGDVIQLNFDTEGEVIDLTWDGRALVVWSRSDNRVFTQRISREGQRLGPPVLRALEAGEDWRDRGSRRVFTTEAAVSVAGQDAWLESDGRYRLNLRIGGATECGAAAPMCAGEGETCDAVDGDCDGRIDENVVVDPAECLTSMPGPCALGNRVGCGPCRPQEEAIAAIIGEPEVCGIDRDCNGRINDPDPITVEAIPEHSVEPFFCERPEWERYCGLNEQTRMDDHRWDLTDHRDRPVTLYAGRTSLDRYDSVAIGPRGSRGGHTLGVFKNRTSVNKVLTFATGSDSMWMGILRPQGPSFGLTVQPTIFLQQIDVEAGGVGEPITLPLREGRFHIYPTLSVEPDGLTLLWEVSSNQRDTNVEQSAADIWRARFSADGEILTPPERWIENGFGPKMVPLVNGTRLLVYTRHAGGPKPDERFRDIIDATHEVVARVIGADHRLSPPTVIGRMTSSWAWIRDDEIAIGAGPARPQVMVGPNSILVAWYRNLLGAPPIQTVALDLTGTPIDAVPPSHAQSTLHGKFLSPPMGAVDGDGFFVATRTGLLHRFDANGRDEGLVQVLRDRFPMDIIGMSINPETIEVMEISGERSVYPRCAMP